MDEYSLLRTEIVECQKERHQYNIALYSAVSGILTFVLPRDEYYLCLIPFAVIVPLYILEESKAHFLCRTGAYLYIFLEGEKYKWEHRAFEFDREEKEAKKIAKKYRGLSSISPYFIIALTCSCLSLSKLYCSSTYSIEEKILRVVCVLLFTIIMISVMVKNTIDFVDERSKMIEAWKQVQKMLDEDKNAETNTKNGGSNYAVSE